MLGGFANNGFAALKPTLQEKKEEKKDDKKDEKEKMAELGPLVSDASAQVKKLTEEDLPALNKKMNDAGIPHIVVKPAEHHGDGGDREESER